VLPTLAREAHATGVTINQRTCVPDWDGHPMDEAMAVEGFSWVDGKSRI